MSNVFTFQQQGHTNLFLYKRAFNKTYRKGIKTRDKCNFKDNMKRHIGLEGLKTK